MYKNKHLKTFSISCVQASKLLSIYSPMKTAAHTPAESLSSWDLNFFLFFPSCVGWVVVVAVWTIIAPKNILQYLKWFFLSVLPKVSSLGGGSSLSFSELTVKRTSYLLLPRCPLSSPLPSSHHVCLHEEPATAPTLSGSRLAKTHLQKPVCPTEGWGVIGWRGSGHLETPQQVCRRRKLICNLGQMRSNAFLCADWLAF